MARIQIDMPNRFIYSTKLKVRVGDVAGGLHLGNHVIISFLNEVLFSFLRDNGFNEYIETPVFINPDFAVVVKSESIYGDILCIDMAISQNGQYGVDLFYKIINEKSGREVALAKMAMLFFDYEKRKLKEMPKKFKTFLKEHSC